MYMKEKYTLKEVHKFADEYDRNLLATDERFNYTIHIVHMDGSSLLYDSAFFMSVGGWLIVFTEHHRYHVYHKDDLKKYRQYKQVDIIEELK